MEFKVTDHGIQPNSHEDIVPKLQFLLEKLKTESNPKLIFSAGEYHFYPTQAIKKDYFMSNTTVINPRRSGIHLENFQNLTIEGNGASFIFHDRMSAIILDNCSDVTINNINIDWDRPLNSESKVVAVGSGYIDIELDKKLYPYKIENGKIIFLAEESQGKWSGVMEFDPESQVIPPKTGDFSLGLLWRLYKATPLQGNLVRISAKFTNLPKIGNYLVMRHHERDHAGIYLQDCRKITLTKINMYNNAGLGILSQYSEDLNFKQINCVPNRPKRMFLSGHDDGLQFSNCRGQLMVDSCNFEGLMDDPINVHGTCVRIIKILSPTKVRARFVHDQSVGMPFGFNGNKIGFISRKTMETRGYAQVIQIHHHNIREFDIEFDSPLPKNIRIKDALENLTWTPDLTIQNCQFLSCRARGILISTPGKVIVQKNFFKSSGSAILIAGDSNGWYESGAVTDVTIRENEFSEFCNSNSYQFCEGIISIYPEVPKLNYRTPYHRNITIEHNIFHPFDYPVLYAASTMGLKFQNNTIERSTRFLPIHPRKAMITLIACSKVQILQNQFKGEVLGMNIKHKKMLQSEIQSDL